MACREDHLATVQRWRFKSWPISTRAACSPDGGSPDDRSRSSSCCGDFGDAVDLRPQGGCAGDCKFVREQGVRGDHRLLSAWREARGRFRAAELPRPQPGARAAVGAGRKVRRPDVLFAPNPSHQIEDQGQRFDYIRPLATIEPTAVTLGLPVNTRWGLQQIMQLRVNLLEPRYAHARIFVAWNTSSWSSS